MNSPRYSSWLQMTATLLTLVDFEVERAVFEHYRLG